MHSKSNIIVSLIGQPVGIPAITQVVGINLLQIIIHYLLIVGQSDFLKAHIHKNREHQPVIRVRTIHMIDLVQPVIYLHFLNITQRLPQLMRRKSKPQSQHSLFHHTLVFG
ncbi:hypothetical protein D3C71_1664680 [compost metagenome]